MNSKITRRKFIECSPIAAGGAMLGYASGSSGAGTKSNMITEPARQIPVVEECDVCVVGGSCTGAFAAIAASRLGAKVVLIEGNGFFGGVATASLVNVWHSIYDTQETKQIIGGLTTETVERLDKRNAVTRIVHERSNFRLATETLKTELDEMVTSAGVQPYLHAFFTAAVKKDDRNIDAVIIEDKSGRRAIRARCFIDATGDADLAERLGLETWRNENIQPPTMCAVIRGIDKIKEKYPDFNLGRVAFDQKYPQALKRGFLWGANVPGTLDEYMMAGTRVFGADCSDADQLTRAEIEGRKQVRAICDILRENFYQEDIDPLVTLPAKIGIRDTRHVRCQYRLTTEDVLYGKRFDDAIANGSYRVDIHLADREGLVFRYLDGTEVFVGVDGNREEDRWREPTNDDPTFYQIPYRSLVPRGIDNMLVAGRCLDAEPGAFGAVRVMVNCNQMGEAAGTAACLALKSGSRLMDIDTRHLRTTLSDNGAIVL